jgi:uncharacterized membrane protein YdjX (TVP38/TMEM64 family)
VLPPQVIVRIRSRTFLLATASGMMISVAMFGAIGYMPTYLQMVHGDSMTMKIPVNTTAIAISPKICAEAQS